MLEHLVGGDNVVIDDLPFRRGQRAGADGQVGNFVGAEEIAPDTGAIAIAIAPAAAENGRTAPLPASSALISCSRAMTSPSWFCIGTVRKERER
jgi:hypothetical protein